MKGGFLFCLSTSHNVLFLLLNFTECEERREFMTETIETISVEEAAVILQKPAQFVRLGLQQRTLPFGAAVRGSGGRYSYIIPKKKFETWLETGGEA